MHTPSRARANKAMSARLWGRLWRSPGKRFLQALRLAANYAAHRRLRRDLREAGMGALEAAFPEYGYKYLGHYLSPFFSVAERAAILGHHYRAVASRPYFPFRRAMAGDSVELWSRTLDGERFSISLDPVGEAFLEGDLALVFRSAGNPLYRISFTFAPGRLAGLDEEEFLFIGGAQGVAGTAAESRQAARAMGEIGPSALLLLQARAIAVAMGMRSMLAVSLRAHSCDSIAKGRVRPVAAYDAFWEANGAEAWGPFFRFPAGLRFHASEAGSTGHRARARRKQERKMLLFSEMSAQLGARQASMRGPVGIATRPAALVPT